jgi:restriction system protein
VIKEENILLLGSKIKKQFVTWDDEWASVAKRPKFTLSVEASVAKRSQEAQNYLRKLENILGDAVGTNNTINWEELLDCTEYQTLNPKDGLAKELSKISLPLKPRITKLLAPPTKSAYEPKLTLVDRILPFIADRKRRDSESKYKASQARWNTDKANWELKGSIIQSRYQAALAEDEKQREMVTLEYCELERVWSLERAEYYQLQQQYNASIKSLKQSYFNKETEAILAFCEVVLNNSEYPDEFPKNHAYEYNPSTKLLVVDYALPAPNHINSLSEVRYISTRNEFKEFFLSTNKFNEVYDKVVYDICLRTLYELFEQDKIESIESIVFNGWVDSINKATGQSCNYCIVSVHANKKEFSEIRLDNVNSKLCFKMLRGVGSSALVGMVPIMPLVQVSKNDNRFIPSYDVAHELDNTYNLAAMKWEDFEHLVREVFEQEFSNNGGEVKVTQSSRDGGVDAIAFDPDPIRGGKIVIQAKRYTNTVELSAVRDLYGTVHNEGAMKGILVTTSDFGPASYDFVKNKPLTLLNGSNLLYLLEKHGHRAKIDIAEAKLMANR